MTISLIILSINKSLLYTFHQNAHVEDRHQQCSLMSHPEKYQQQTLEHN